MKTFFFLILISLSSQAAPAKSKAPSCSFVRHQYIEVEGKDLAVEIKNKILNTIETKLEVIKENLEFNLRLCSVLHPLKKIKDVPLKNSQPGQEHLITKISLTPKDGFWILNIDTFGRADEKSDELTKVWGDIESKSLKPQKELKNSELADWVLGRVKTLSSK